MAAHLTSPTTKKLMKILVTSPIGLKGVHTPAGSIVDLPTPLALEIIHSGRAVEHIESKASAQVESVAPVAPVTSSEEEAPAPKSPRKKG
jgi:hypothetical protein